MAKKSLGPPPAMVEARSTLSQPETAPAKLDRRTLRNTGRSVQFNVKISPSFQDELNRCMKRDRLTGWQFLSVAAEAYNRLSDQEKNALIKQAIDNDPAMQQFMNRQ